MTDGMATSRRQHVPGASILSSKRFPMIPISTTPCSSHLGRSRRPLFALGPLVILALLLTACGSGSVARPLATLTPTAPASVIYAALGASDAVGIGADDPNTQGYVPILISRLPKNARALNLGIGGIHLHEALTQEMPDAIADHPTLVTVWLVGNDFRDCTPLAQ